VFNYQYEDGTSGPNYRDIFPTPPPPGLVPSCAEGGVLGVLPGIIGSFQASEIIKIITGIGDPLVAKLFVFDALSFETRTMKINKNPGLEPITELIDYDDFCGVSSSVLDDDLEISVKELAKNVNKDPEGIQIIDVREPLEFETGNIGGRSIPLNELRERINEISAINKTVVICRSGVRSRKAAKILVESGFNNVYNLNGGLLKWVEEIDNTLTVI